jgi:hypothetical protein
MAATRTPEEIRASVEAHRADFALSVEKLRGEIDAATDWRRHLVRNHQNILIGAAAAGFILGGGLAGLAGLFRR